MCLTTHRQVRGPLAAKSSNASTDPPRRDTRDSDGSPRSGPAWSYSVAGIDALVSVDEEIAACSGGGAVQRRLQVRAVGSALWRRCTRLDRRSRRRRGRRYHDAESLSLCESGESSSGARRSTRRIPLRGHGVQGGQDGHHLVVLRMGGSRCRNRSPRLRSIADRSGTRSATGALRHHGPLSHQPRPSRRGREHREVVDVGIGDVGDLRRWPTVRTRFHHSDQVRVRGVVVFEVEVVAIFEIEVS